MKRLTTTLLLIFLSSGVQPQESTVDELRDSIVGCARASNEQERLGCYDAIAENLGVEIESRSAAHAATDASASTAPAIPPVPEKFGEREDEIYRTTIVRCEESRSSRRHYFYFDNGQVWRQSNSGRLRMDECTGEAFLEKDMFGFKLRFESEGSAIRVRLVE